MDAILAFLPEPLRKMIDKLPEPVRAQVEELRVREGRPLEMIRQGESAFVTVRGELASTPQDAYRPTRDVCLKLLDLLTNHSLYTFEEELKRGYITVAGGHRVGLAGRTVLEHGRVKLIRDVGSFNIRVAREMIGVGRGVLPALWDEASANVHQTLVISPPRHGKTTLIRDLARLISAGGWSNGHGEQAGRQVGIVDERSEIAACVKGVPVFDVGPRTDVLDGCPKAEGMMMLIRSMAPDVLVVDEIGRPEDAEAIHEALHAGVRVIASAHGRDIEDVSRRPVMRELLRERLFERFVILSRSRGTGVRQLVCDGYGQPLPVRASDVLQEAGRPLC